MKTAVVLLLFMSLCQVLHAQGPLHAVTRSLHGTANSLTLLPLTFHHPPDAILMKTGPVAGQLNGRPLYRSQVRKGRLHGLWQSWYQNGQLCDSGSLVRGVPDGVWKYWDDEGKLIAIRTYSAAKFQRLSKALSRSNPKHVKYPLVALYNTNRSLALSHFHVSSSFDNVRFEGFSLDDMVSRNIFVKDHYTPVFNRSLHHGLFMNFHANGAIRDSGSYENGLRHGLWKHAGQNGEMEKGLYAHGRRIREWRTYDAGGKLSELIIYSRSGKIKSKKFFR